MVNSERKPRDRIAASEIFDLTKYEYDGKLSFEAWEAEDGSGHRGVTVIFHDEACGVDVAHRFQVEY